MPLYVCVCPDLAGSLSNRRKARAAHLEMGQRDRREGRIVFGRAYTDDTIDPREDKVGSNAPDGLISPYTRGSTMIYRYPSIDLAWQRLRNDPYWLQDVWDREKVMLYELAPGPEDETLKMV
uniref:YCII-related domain-containing protein n=1 Tax=Kwoniella dejecticola CBS 10117 TaxID=1296121 RepID=A0A1A6A8L5_9TREE|nr:uncharacterized protein I303_04119 [Kwoniella dejecticola CBS 10117]OBR86395.1 hypothetical protein I303_04119 [Kwoniella dejecticola CBS 10117]